MKKTTKWLFKAVIIAMFAMFATLIPITIFADADSGDATNKDGIPIGFAAQVGYKGFELKGSEYKFSHNTHPNDFFLPGSGIPGSAGTTDLDGSYGNFAAFGFRYQNVIVPRLTYNIDVGGLIGPNRDSHQNKNDMRPAANGAFVYSKAMFGFYSGLGIAYHPKFIKGFYFGAGAEINGLFVSHGWDRYNEDESVDSTLKWIPAFGPRVGYHYQNFNIEAAANFGESSGFALTIGLFF